MAQLLLITELSLSNGRQVNDIVTIKPDDWKFSEHELKIFKLVKTKGEVKDLVSAIPETIDWVDPLMPDLRHQAWKTPDGEWKKVVSRPKQKARWEDGKVTENYSRYAENTLNSVELETIG